MGITTSQVSGSGELIMAGSGSVMGDMGVSGSLKVASHGATGAGETAISGAGDLNVGGNVYIEGTLNLSSSISGASGAITIRSGDATKFSKIAMGTNANKVTIGVPGAADTFFSDTAQGDLVLRADDNNNKVHIGAGSSGGAGMVVTEVSNVGRVGIGTVSPSHPLTVAGAISGSSTIDIVGAATFESTLNVTGAIYTAAGLITSGAISGSSTLDIVGATTLESTLNVTGAIHTAASITSSTTVTAESITASVGLLAAGAITAGGALNVTGAATFAGAISGAVGITGSSITVNDTIELNANGKITKAHSISGSNDISFLNIYANNGGTNSAKLLGTGEISASGPLNVVGATTLESTLNVTGAIYTAAGLITSGAISGSSTIDIVGAATFESTLNVTGAATFAGAISGAVGITGSSITINDTIELNANGNITKAASYSGSSDVSALNLYANNGGTNSAKLLGTGEISASGPLNIAGAAEIFGGLITSGAISGSSTLDIVGATTIEGALSVTGAITTAGRVNAVSLSGSVGLSSSYTHTNNLAVNDGGTKSIRLNGDGTVVIAGGAAGETCLSSSGDINVVGMGYFERTLNVTGTITTAAGITASSGLTSSYAHTNNLAINDGGTKSIRFNGDGTAVFSGIGAGETCISASGDINIRGDGYISGEFNVTGGVTVAKTAASHDIANGEMDTQNVRAGSVTYTFNGGLGNNSSLILSISSSAVKATDVIMMSTAEGGNAGAGANPISCSLMAHGVHDNGFKFFLTNKSGGSIADDATVIINWIVL